MPELLRKVTTLIQESQYDQNDDQLNIEDDGSMSLESELEKQSHSFQESGSEEWKPELSGSSYSASIETPKQESWIFLRDEIVQIPKFEV